MKTDEIKDFGRRTAARIARGELHDALAEMRATSERLMLWEATARVDRLAEHYRYLLDYFGRGVADPGRERLLGELRADARALADELVRRAHLAENPDLYFSTARTLGVRRDESIASLIADYRAEERRLNEDYTTVADPRRRSRAEQLMRDIFGRVWTTYPLSASDIEAIGDFLARPGTRTACAAMTVSALSMGLMQYFEPARLELLLSAYMADADAEVALRALTGFVLATFRFRRRPLPARVLDMLAAAREGDRWEADFKAVAVELLRARDTERLAAKMRDELYPTLMRLQGDLRDKIGRGDLDPEALAADGANPEWEELLHREGITDKLKEMSEIQADGGDVFLAAFSHLKQFPFFREAAHWFMPYHDEQTDVASLDGLDGSVGSLLRLLPMLCDSDKYSVTLSMAQMPAAQRESAMTAMRLQGEQAREMLSELDKADPAARRRNILNKYVQDLYRFHTLFRRKGEFFDPFAAGVNLFDVATLTESFDDTDTLRVAGEFSMRHHLWPEAARLLERLDSLLPEPDAGRAQKIGFCYESMGEVDRAISRYEEAEMLDGGSRWTLRRLAAVWRRKGRPDKAVAYYRRLSEALPDDFDTTLNYAYALTEAGRTAEAEAQYHKAVYYDPESVDARRGLAWTQYVGRKLDEAVESYTFVIGRDARPSDYLNAGHVARAQGRVPEALNFYKLSMLAAGKDTAALLADLDADARWLDRPEENILYIETIKNQ